MYKIITEDNKTVYLSLDAVQEVVIDPSMNESVIYTGSRSYKVTDETANDLIETRRDRSNVRLTTAINNLTQILRARLR